MHSFQDCIGIIIWHRMLKQYWRMNKLRVFRFILWRPRNRSNRFKNTSFLYRCHRIIKKPIILPIVIFKIQFCSSEGFVGNLGFKVSVFLVVYLLAVGCNNIILIFLSLFGNFFIGVFCGVIKPSIKMLRILQIRHISTFFMNFTTFFVENPILTSFRTGARTFHYLLL